jgi:hypothetical protein
MLTVGIRRPSFVVWVALEDDVEEDDKVCNGQTSERNIVDND